MTTPIAILALVSGFVLLIGGAELLVRNASRLGLHYGLKPIIVGATIVAFATSAPELLVSMLAQIRGKDAIALGNVIGSNVANIGLVLGAASLVFPILVTVRAVRIEYVMALLGSLLLFLLGHDGSLDLIDGVILTGIFVVFMLAYTTMALRGRDEVPADLSLDPALRPTPGRWWILSVVGLSVLLLGSNFVVDGASQLATNLGVAAATIGATIIAVGTSLPELATSVIAAIKKENEIAVGNVLGSNMFNVFFVLGPIAMIRPIQVEAAEIDLYIPFMIGISFAILPMMIFFGKINRIHGILLLAAYGAFVWMRYQPA